MSQGTPRDKDTVFEALKHYFQLGCSVKKACAYAGIPASTVETWLAADDDLRARVTAWQNEISAKARANWRAKVAQQDYGASKEWLERQESDEFSTRTKTETMAVPDAATQDKLDGMGKDIEEIRASFEAALKAKING